MFPAPVAATTIPSAPAACSAAIGVGSVATVATGGTPIAALHAAGADGFVVAATGAGNTDPSLLAAAEAAIADGIPVAVATRCPAGAAGTGYAFPGGGATWLRGGALFAGHLTGPKARIALALGIGAGLGHEGLAALLADPVPIHDPDRFWGPPPIAARTGRI